MPKKGVKCDYIPKGIKNEQSYVATRFDWSLGTAKYKDALLDELRTYVGVSAMVKDRIEDYGYSMCTVNTIKSEGGFEATVTDRKMRYKDFLFECGFFYENFGWERIFEITDLRTVFTNINLLQIILYMIVCDILDDIECQPEKGCCKKVDKESGADITEEVENTLELCREEILVVGSILNKIMNAEDKKETEVELSSSEYYTLVSLLFGEENVLGFQCGEVLDELGQLSDNTECLPVSWYDIKEYLETKFSGVIDRVFPEIEEKNEDSCNEEVDSIAGSDSHGNMEVWVPRFMRSLLLGVIYQCEQLPITVDVNLWGNGTWEDVKWLYDVLIWGEIKDKKTGDVKEGWRKWYFSNNYPRIRNLIMPPAECSIKEETFKAFYSLITYLRYSNQMDERKNRSDIFARYLSGVGGITYYLAKEKKKEYQEGSVWVFESMFGMYVMILELEVIHGAIKVGRLKMFGEIWDIYLPKLLRQIFNVKNPFIRIYIVKNFLEQCVDELINSDGMGIEAGIVDDWNSRFNNIEAIGKDLENESRKSEPDEKKIKRNPMMKYYKDIIEAWNWTDGREGVIDRKQVNEFKERLAGMKALYADYDENVVSWMIKANLGLLENFRIKVTE